MNFSKRKIIFITLLQVFLFTALVWFSGSIDRNWKQRAHTAEVTSDTSGVEPVKVEMIGEEKKKINNLDQGSTKTVNLILFLIYELTFKKMN
jgi:hypothetical protein